MADTGIHTSPENSCTSGSRWYRLTITTEDGTVYENVTVNKVEEDTVTITHDAGNVKIPLEELTPELQQRFNYDPKRAEAARQRRDATMAEQKAKVQEQAEAARMAAEEKKLHVQLLNCEVRQVVKGGLFVQTIVPSDSSNPEQLVYPLRGWALFRQALLS